MVKKRREYATKAHELAEKQREISVSEFFAKNRHLLGFDNPRKALLMAVKEAVDNSLDATQEANILSDIYVELQQLKEDRFKVIVEDNGPGIVKEQIPKIFGKLLYGSKFHRLRQSLTADEPIFVKVNNKVKILPIGEFVDSYLKEDEGDLDISNLDIKVPAFDFKTYKYSMKNVNHVIKHKRENEVIKIKTDSNREIKVTGCHSLFTVNESGEVIEVEARSFEVGDYLVVPKKLPSIDKIDSINVLDYLSYNDIKSNWIYVYGIKDLVNDLEKQVGVIYKKKSGDKSRRYYKINDVEILDDSFKQYKTKGFLPLKLVYNLGLQNEVSNGYLRTYRHGEEFKLPIILPIISQFARFLGLYVAEGHSDKRQIGLTFGKHEEVLINEVITFTKTFGLGITIEPREASIRLKIFNNCFVKFIHNVCGKDAHNKIIPEFIFKSSEYIRQEFLDAYCQGDGCQYKDKNSLTHSTVSKNLAIQLGYLFLMQGVSVGHYEIYKQGLGKSPSLNYIIYLNGDDINKSHIFETQRQTKTRAIYFNSNKQITMQIQNQESRNILLNSDLLLVRIKDIEIINEGHDYVYDLSVPEYENFVGGFGGVSCHNSRGQQGIGISAVLLYGQLTTGKGMHITSKIGSKHPAHYFEIHLDTQKNEPIIRQDKVVEWKKEHGTRLEIELQGIYQKGKQSVDEYIKEIALINPHAQVIYKTSDKETITYARAMKELPKEAKEIKPHPYGVELGVLIRMLQGTKTGTVSGFLQNDFCRVSQSVSHEICEKAKINPRARPNTIARDEAEALYNSIQNTKIIAPPTDCLSPLGEDALIKGLKKEINAEFYCAATRPPSVYRGNPFLIEVGLAYGGSLEREGHVKIMRYANRVPLLYQQGACASSESITDTSWKSYGLSQSKDSLPVGPVVIVIHMVSVWVPFTSEAKEAIAHYPEIIKDMKLALQEAGRQMYSYIRKNVRAREQQERVNLFGKYIPELASALSNLSGEKKSEIEENLQKVLKKGLKHLLAGVIEAEKTVIKGKNVAFGEKQKTLQEVEYG